MQDQLRLEATLLRVKEAFDDGSVMPNSFAINKTEPTNKIVFVSLDSNINTDQLPIRLSTCLLNRDGFTVARKTRDKDRVELFDLTTFLRSVKFPKGT